jgi:hypothetical protein
VVKKRKKLHTAGSKGSIHYFMKEAGSQGGGRILEAVGTRPE